MLPLRLAIEPFFKSIIGSCFVLPSKDEEKLCYVIGDQGLLAFALSQPLSSAELFDLSHLHSEEWPHYTLTMKENKYSWSCDGVLCVEPPTREEIISSTNQLSKALARTILEGIMRYYSRQVLEPSIRGFLGILEKQFPRNDLYLFELLQNAVDDGANIVVMKSIDSAQPGLLFCHNGRRFSPLDILGLASVGLSTKGAEDKKKIGFMGVGFKAVYKRYSCVTIYDDVWNLQFREPHQTPHMEPSHSWVLKPHWVDSDTSSQYSDRALPSNLQHGLSNSWCHFLLQHPRGGIRAVLNDLTHLPLNVPVLLGRQHASFQSNAETHEWILYWETSKYRVSCLEKVTLPTPQKSLVSRKSSAGSLVKGFFDQVEIEISQLVGRTKIEKKPIQFITASFHPSFEAQEAFEIHTKKKWITQANVALENDQRIFFEDISIFFELDTHGIPIASGRSGIIHAILPTKLTMPCCINLQGSWLLSVDRQDVQNISDNEWNLCLLNQTPRLFLLLLRWISQQSSKINSFSSSLKCYYQLFPKVNPPESPHCSSLHIRIMNHIIPLDEMVSALRSENLIPSRSTSENHPQTEVIQFRPSSEVIWLPPVMMKFLPAALIHDWFGLWPLASFDLDERAWDPLWLGVTKLPTSEILMKRRSFLYQKDHSLETNIASAIRILAGFGAFLEFINTSQHPNSPQATAKEIYGSSFPSLDLWPVFLDEEGKGVPLSEIVWLDSEEFSSLNQNDYKILRQGAPLAAQLAEIQDSRNKYQNPNEIKVVLLHHELEDFLKRKSHPQLPIEYFRLATECLQHGRAMYPSRIIGVDAACSALLSGIALACSNSTPSPEDLDRIVHLFQWAMNSSRPKAISHLLVDDLTTTRLLPSNETYSPKLIGSHPVKGLSLFFVSNVYKKSINLPDHSPKFFDFIEKCGCQTGLALRAHSRNLTSFEQSKILNGQLPKLRHSNPAVQCLLPFNLGPLTKRKCEIVDVDLTPEWQHIFGNASQDVVLATLLADLVCSALENIDTVPIPTAETTPYLSSLLNGLPQPSDSIYHSNRVPSDSTIFPTPAFARMFFLPPAQPGAAVRSLSPAEWIYRLARTRWVPAISPGTDSPSRVLRPCEVIFPGKLVANSLSCEGIMPRANFSERQIRILEQLNPEISTIFAWGTVTPPPPLEDLERISEENFDTLSETSDEIILSFGGAVSCSSSKYLEVVSIWRRLLIASKENRLSPSDKSRIFKVCYPRGNKASPYIIPGRKNTLISSNRCLGWSSTPESDEHILAQSLSQIGFLFSLNPSALPDSWPLIEDLPVLLDLLRPPTTVSLSCLQDYLIQSSNHILRTNSSQPPSPLQNQIYSYSLWIISKKVLSVAEIEGVLSRRYSSDIVEKVRNHLISQIPDLIVFCQRGPGSEKSTYPNRWMKIWPVDAQRAPVRPILLDDDSIGTKGCGILKSSLLNKDHKFQPVGLLDHCLQRNFSNPHLLNVEDFLLKVLNIPRISDPNFFSVSAKCNGKQEFLKGATERLGVILALLQVLAPDQVLPAVSEKRLQTPPILKYPSLSLLFRYPKFDGKLIGLSESSTFPVYALRGGLTIISVDSDGQYFVSSAKGEDKSKAIQSLLISGNPHDYATELDDIVLTVVFGPQRPFNPSIRKALSLLVHLESQSQFLKYFDRYFGGMFHPQNGEILPPDGEIKYQQFYEYLAAAIESLRSKTIEVEIEEQIKNIGAAESLFSSLAPPTPTAVESPSVSLRGLGRGVCNLPAWLTTDPKPDIPNQNLDDTNKTTLKRNREHSEEQFSLQPDEKLQRLSHTDRGISNLPSWMTERDINLENKRPRQILTTDSDNSQYQDASEQSPELSKQHNYKGTQQVLMDLFSLIRLAHDSLPETTVSLISILSSLPTDYQLLLESQLCGSLKEEIVSALSHVPILNEEPTPSEVPFVHLRRYLNLLEPQSDLR